MAAAQSKPLGGKAYGSIPHLPGSRMGPADHHCHDGQRVICCDKARDRHDRIIVAEKLDGSCVAIAKIDGRIFALSRAGYAARSSPYEQHHIFADWVDLHNERFDALLRDGERVCGEWLAQAHGTRYLLSHEPFVVFDMFAGKRRIPHDEAQKRSCAEKFVCAAVLHDGAPFSIDAAAAAIAESRHGAIDPVEGAVWRVERKGSFDFIAKWVRPDKIDGRFLPSVTQSPGCVWNWRP